MTDERGRLVAERTDFYVEGYYFTSIQDAEQAKLEQKKAAYFESRLQGKNVWNILAVYDQILDNKIFRTPIGWNYLEQMQQRLRAMGVAEERIRPIPVYVSFTPAAYQEEVFLKHRKKPDQAHDKNSGRLKISFIINVVLVVLVAAMFAIAVNSSNPNILNYKKAIVNEYAAWDQELREREEAVRQKEAALFTD